MSNQYPNPYNNTPVHQSQLDAIFDEVETAEPVNTYAQRLPEGTHTVILLRYGAKNSQQKLGTILEADFMIEKSTNPAVAAGEKRGWPWFPQRTGWAGTFEKDRVKNFMGAVDISAGNQPRTTKETGGDLASGKFRGMRLLVTVTPVFDNNGNRRSDKKGRPMSNAEFAPLQQTAEQIAQTAAQLPQEVARQAPRQAPQPQGYQQPQQGYAPQGYAPAPQGYAPPPGYAQAPQGYAPGYAPAPQGQMPVQGAPQGVPQGQSQQGAPNPLPQIIQNLRGGYGQ